MNRIDLIIDALEGVAISSCQPHKNVQEALAAARELRDNYVCLEKLPKPVDDVDIDFFGEVTK